MDKQPVDDASLNPVMIPDLVEVTPAVTADGRVMPGESLDGILDLREGICLGRGWKDSFDRKEIVGGQSLEHVDGPVEERDDVGSRLFGVEARRLKSADTCAVFVPFMLD